MKGLHFIGQFFKFPKQVGTLTQSSKALAKKIRDVRDVAKLATAA
jgi:phospholipid N-methyltransferase